MGIFSTTTVVVFALGYALLAAVYFRGIRGDRSPLTLASFVLGGYAGSAAAVTGYRYVAGEVMSLYLHSLPSLIIISVLAVFAALVGSLLTLAVRHMVVFE